MDIETRVTNLENMLANIMKNMNNNKFYTDADIGGCRHTEGELNTKAEQIEEKSDTTTATVDGIMTDVIPELANADASMTATIDSILTDIIPSIIGE